MKRPSALVLCAADPNSSPRPNRMIHWLKDEYEVSVVGWTQAQIEGVLSYPLFTADQDVNKMAAGKFEGLERYLQLLRYLSNLITGRHEAIVWSRLGQARQLQTELVGQEFDLIVSHDITLLPLAFGLKKGHSRVVLDAREYYNREYEDNWKWRLLYKPVNQYLCDRYLHQCDKVFTVNDGLAEEYKKEYGVLPDVLMSLPRFMDLKPQPVNNDRIRIIYHGYASPSRGTETMIEMMDFLDERFLLDLMLVAPHDPYSQKMIAMAMARKNVNIIPPVTMPEIVPFTNQYDIGLYLCPPTSFNQKYTLPNKFFEFIQARLAIAIGPSIEMVKIVRKHDCGVVSEDFQPRSLAAELNRLTADRIMHHKRQSHQAAGELNSEINKSRIQRLFHELLAKN